MRTRITAALVSLSIAVSAALPAPMALAAPAERPGAVIDGAQVIQAGERDRRWRDDDGDWREGDRRRWDGRDHRRDHRRDRWRDDRREDGWRHDRWRDDRRADRRRHDRWRDDRRRDHRHGYRRGHRHDRDRGHDAAPYILGGIALGTILLLNILEHEDDRDRGYRR